MVKSRQTRQDKKRLTDKFYWLEMAMDLFSGVSHLRTLPNSSQVLCVSVENEWTLDATRRIIELRELNGVSKSNKYALRSRGRLLEQRRSTLVEMCGTKDPRPGSWNILLIRTRTPAQVLGHLCSFFTFQINSCRKDSYCFYYWCCCIVRL
jgi:hypothetical protein